MKNTAEKCKIYASKCIYLHLHDTNSDTPTAYSMKYPTIRLVFDRKKVATTEKKGLIQIEVLFQGKRKFISTGVKVFAGQFKNDQVLHRSDAIELNNQIAMLVTTIREWITELYKNKESFSFEKMNTLFTFTSNPHSFLSFVEERIQKRKIQNSTKKQHEVMLNALKEFGTIQTFSDLIPKNIKLFDDYIKSKVTTQSSVYSYHKRLKTYINEAIQLEIIKSNPYHSFQTPRGDHSHRKYLEKEELSRIEKLDLDQKKTLCKVRDCFVFCCYTGLAYSDLSKFSWKEDVIQKEGKYFIEDVRQKTGTRYKIQILSPAFRILEKYDFCLPVYSNQKMNEYLKVIADIAHIKKNLTSHCARHTFATWALSQGVRIETVSKMLAHKDIQTTQIYAKILQQEVEDGFDLLESKVAKI